MEEHILAGWDSQYVDRRLHAAEGEASYVHGGAANHCSHRPAEAARPVGRNLAAARDSRQGRVRKYLGQTY